VLAELAHGTTLQRTCAASAAGGQEGTSLRAHAVLRNVLRWQRVGNSYGLAEHTAHRLCPMPARSALLSACSRQAGLYVPCAPGTHPRCPGDAESASRMRCSCAALLCSECTLAVCDLGPNEQLVVLRSCEVISPALEHGRRVSGECDVSAMSCASRRTKIRFSCGLPGDAKHILQRERPCMAIAAHAAHCPAL
jgi:hypothetical protein